MGRLPEHERVDAAELEQQVEDAEFCCQKEVLHRWGEVDLAVVAEVRHHIDNRGGNERHDQRLGEEEPWMSLWERGVLDDHAHIAQKDDRRHDGNQEEICQNETSGDAADRELEGDLRGEDIATEDSGQNAAEGEPEDCGEEERVRVGEGGWFTRGHPLWSLHVEDIIRGLQIGGGIHIGAVGEVIDVGVAEFLGCGGSGVGAATRATVEQDGGITVGDEGGELFEDLAGGDVESAGVVPGGPFGVAANIDRDLDLSGFQTGTGGGNVKRCRRGAEDCVGDAEADGDDDESDKGTEPRVHSKGGGGFLCM